MRPTRSWSRALGSLLLLPLPVLLLSACPDNGRAPRAASAGSGSSMLSSEIQGLIDRRCVQCHMAKAPQAGLVLEDTHTPASLVGVPSKQAKKLLIVQPGDPARSYMMIKLRGEQKAAGGTGQRMPLGQRPLSQEEMSRLERWIKGLARR